MHGWSQDRSVWIALKEKFKGNKWRRVPFDPGKAYLVASGPGIYAICAKVPLQSSGRGPSGAYKPMYIGRAARENGGIRARFLDHTRRPKPSVQRMASCFHETIEFWYATVDSKELIEELEALCLEAFGPECNDIRAPKQRVILASLNNSVPA